MDPDFEPTYTMYCGDGGDGGGDGGGDASSPGDTGGAGGDDEVGGNDAGGRVGLDYLMGIDRTNYQNGGMTLKQLQAKAPPGEFLAYINPEEAGVLKALGGSGKKINGIPSFFASSPGDTGGAGGADGAGGNDAGGGGSDASGNDTSPGATGGAGGDPGDPGSEASGGTSGGGGVSDTGDLGSEAANVAATQSGAASVGAGSGVTDTGDLGTEAENVAATVSGAASVGLDSTSFTNPYSKTGMIAKNISNYMKGNIAETALASALTAITGIPGLAALNAYNSIYGSPISSTVSGVSSDDVGGGDTGTAITSVAPYLIGNTQAQPSQVLQYFSNLQNQPQAEGLLSRYDQAKQNVSGILGTNNQLGASNTSNFYYNYLNQRGLL